MALFVYQYEFQEVETWLIRHLLKLAVEAAIQVAKDEESRKRLLAIILAPTIFLLILIAFILYLVTSPLVYADRVAW